MSALLLSLAAIALIAPIQNVDALNALSQYAGARAQLRAALSSLDNDPCWHAFQRSAEHAPQLAEQNLAALLRFACWYDELGNITPEVVKATPEPSASLIAPRGKRAPSPTQGPPAAPANLRFRAPMRSIESLASSVATLGNVKLLASAQSVHQYRFGWSVNEWGTQVFLLFALRSKSTGSDGFYSERRPLPSPHFGDNLKSYLTLADYRQLSAFAYPDLPDIERVILDDSRIALPGVATPVGLTRATLAVQFALLASLIYFALYQREARLSPSFPSPGTIFAVFRRSRVAVAVFVVFCLVPASAACVLALSCELYTQTVPAIAHINAGLALMSAIAAGLILRNGLRP